MSETSTLAGGTVQIRKAGPGDLHQCACIVNDWIDECAWMPRIHTREKIASFFTPDLLDRRHLLLADDNGEIVGYLSADHDHYIHALYLRAGVRGKGIGSALMHKAKEMFPDELRLGVHVPNRRARDFYERQGFVETGRIPAGDTDEGIEELRMRWTGRRL